MWFLKTPNDISFLTKYDLFFVWSHTLKFLCILLPNCRMHISQLTIFNLQFLLSPVRIISYLYGPCTQLPYYIIQLLENARISMSAFSNVSSTQKNLGYYFYSNTILGSHLSPFFILSCLVPNTDFSTYKGSVTLAE